MSLFSSRPASTASENDSEVEPQRFFNFLQHYGLQRYHGHLRDIGVSRISHLKSVDDKDLELIGFSRSEMNRLRRKLDENFSVTGRLMKRISGRANQFDSCQDMAVAGEVLSSSPGPTASLIAKEEIRLNRRIGEGAHGSVHEGTWSNVHGAVTVAVKTLYGSLEEVQGQFIKEADSMRALRHPHIVQLYGIVLSTPLMLVEELASLGCLHAYLQKKGPSLNLRHFHTYACQVADAMAYLEAKRIVHRDLAARNILLSTEDLAKLSDFGMARVLDEHSDVYKLSNLQSRIPIAWTAVEALQNAQFSSASDVWSYGVTLWELYSLARHPWEGLAPLEVRDSLLRGERLGQPQRCPPAIFELMTACWSKEPKDRPTFVEIHKKIKTLSPALVRAVQSNEVEGEREALSFRTGELIYVIEQPTPEWILGMKVTGAVGHFESDQVSRDLDPIADLKERLQTGRSKVSSIPIGPPMAVSHELHWGSDGKRWGTDPSQPKEQPSPTCGSRVLEADGSNSIPRSSTGSGRSDSSPGPGRSGSSHSAAHRPLQSSPSPSPRGSSPSPTHTDSGGVALSGSQVSCGDAHFLGELRYASRPQGAPSSREGGVASEGGGAGDLEDNQYVEVFNAAEAPTLGPVPEGATPPTLGPVPEGATPPTLDPDYDYLRMQSVLRPDGATPPPLDADYDYLRMQSVLRPLHTYNNMSYGDCPDNGDTGDSPVVLGRYRETVAAYAVTGQEYRERISSSDSSEAVLLHTPSLLDTRLSRSPSPPTSLLDTMEEYQARQLPPPLQPTVPTVGPSPGSAHTNHTPSPSHPAPVGGPSPSDPAPLGGPSPTSVRLHDPQPPTGATPPAEDAVVPTVIRFSQYQAREGSGGVAPPAGYPAQPTVPQLQQTNSSAPHSQPRQSNIRALYSEQKSISFDDSSPLLQGLRQPPVPDRLHGRSASAKYSSSARKAPSPRVPRQPPAHHYERLPSPAGPPPLLHQGPTAPPTSSPRVGLAGSTAPPPSAPGARLAGSTAPRPPLPYRSTTAPPPCVLVPEFPNIPESVCLEVLERHHGNLSHAREELQVQVLMAMSLPHITAEDCRRALSHCQGKLERAASWLLDQSTSLARQKT